MGNKHLLQMVLTVCWCGLVVPARGGAPQVVFDGYSARAEAAVERMLRGVSRLKTYADDAVIKMEMGAALQQPEMVMSVVYEAPHRFHIRTMVHEVVSDGRTLSVYMKQSRRYKVEPLERDVGEQIGQYVGALGLDFGVAELLVSEDPRKAFADTFKGLDVTGLESIDGDRCLVLEGVMGEALMNMAGADVPATLYIRERDMMLRRLELDLLEGVKEQFEGAEALSGMLEEYRLVYDVRGLVVNKPLERDAFSFEPPEGAKKVDQFHSMWLHVGRSAAQFELSGKPAPDFSLETTDGDVFALSAERGRVVVLHFVWSQFGFQDPSIRKLETIRREFESKGVVFVSIFPGANADKLLERRREDGVEMRVVLDPDRVAVDAYFNERYAMGIVLVDRQGIVQGRYRMLQQKNTDQYLRDDLEKLLAGKGLAGGKVMSEAEIREAQEQRAAVFTGASASDPINEADLHEAWSVRTRASGTFGFGGGAARRPGGELWVRHGDKVRRVSAAGKVTAELPLPDVETTAFAQERFVVGRPLGRLGVVYMVTRSGDSVEGSGYRPPVGVTFTACDESGRTLWTFDLDVQQSVTPQSLTLADVDGRRGDELVFTHNGALWIIDGYGDVVVRKPLTGWVKWVVVDDRDGDGAGEIYVRTQQKLIRYDYAP